MSVAAVGGLRLLVVDDEAHIAHAIADYFAGAGCEVDCAACVAAALEFLEAFDYAAVVTDLRLSAAGRPDGLEIVSYARRRRPGCACIVLTAHVDAESARLAELRGADAVLQKPAPLPSVTERILQILGRTVGGDRETTV